MTVAKIKILMVKLFVSVFNFNFSINPKVVHHFLNNFCRKLFQLSITQNTYITIWYWLLNKNRVQSIQVIWKTTKNLCILDNPTRQRSKMHLRFCSRKVYFDWKSYIQILNVFLTKRLSCMWYLGFQWAFWCRPFLSECSRKLPSDHQTCTSSSWEPSPLPGCWRPFLSQWHSAQLQIPGKDIIGVTNRWEFSHYRWKIWMGEAWLWNCEFLLVWISYWRIWDVSYSVGGG